MAATPGFANTPRFSSVTITTVMGGTVDVPTSNQGTVFAAGSAGSRIDEVRVVGLATTAAGVINLYLLNSSTYYLFDQVLVSAVTSSGTAVAWQQARTYQNLVLASGWSLAATTMVTQSFKISAFGADF